MIRGDNNQFVDVDLQEVRIYGRDIVMERCHGQTVYLHRNAQVQPFKDCTFNHIINEN